MREMAGPKRKVELYGIWQTDKYKPPPAVNVSSRFYLFVSLSVIELNQSFFQTVLI